MIPRPGQFAACLAENDPPLHRQGPGQGGGREEIRAGPPQGRWSGQGGAMTILHCPICVGLAMLSVIRATSHVTLVGLSLIRVARPTSLQA